MSDTAQESRARERLLLEVQAEIKWQWRWEKKYRRLHYHTILVSWLSGFIILVVCTYQFQVMPSVPEWTIMANAFLSMLSVSLPLLSNAFKFQQRQEVYDRMARAYSLLNTKVEMGCLSTEEALKQFETIHSQPTEKVIRDTA